MKKVMVCYANYTGEKKDFFNSLTEENFREYCNTNDIEFYMVKDKSRHSIDRHPTWMSWQIINDLMKNYLNMGDKVFSLDADTCIVDMNANLLSSNKSFSYAIDSCNTHCMGYYAITVNDWSKKFVGRVLDENVYQRRKDTPIWKMWNDQASVYELFGIKRHSWKPFSLLPNNGWHSSVSQDTTYSLNEIYENVEILPTTYNVTHVTGESFNEFFINPTPGSDTIIRHFAGCPTWDANYFKEVKRK